MKKSKKKKKSKKDKKHKKTKSKGEIKVEEEPRAGLPHSDSNLSITSHSPEMESEMTKKRSVSTSN